MKKFLTLSFGIVLLGSFVILQSEAARGWYSNNRGQECVYKSGKLYCERTKPRAIRAFSNRIGPYQYRKPTRKQLKYLTAADFSHPTRRHDAWFHSPYRKPTMSYRKQKELTRFTHPDLYPRNKNILQNKVHMVHRTDYKVASTVLPTPRFVYNFNDKNKWSLPTYFRTPIVGTYRTINPVIIIQ